MKEVEVEDKVEEERSPVNRKSLEGTRGLAPLPIEPAVHGSQLVNSTIKNFIRAFDLSQAPLLRVGLIKIEPQQHILMVDMHHIITDGTSQEIFTWEFMALYGNRGEELPGLKIHENNYHRWTNQR